jgi:hypothetical protein
LYWLQVQAQGLTLLYWLQAQVQGLLYSVQLQVQGPLQRQLQAPVQTHSPDLMR